MDSGLLGVCAGRLLLGAWSLDNGALGRRALDPALVGFFPAATISGTPDIGARMLGSMEALTTVSATPARVTSAATGAAASFITTAPC